MTGFKIPLTKVPKQKIIPKEPKWSNAEIEEIKISINNLLIMGAICRVKSSEGQYLSNIFLTKKSDGSNRLIINLKSFNKYVRTNHFKIEDHKTVKRILEDNCYMATIDLKDAYTTVPIHYPHRKFLRFKFCGQIYQYNCLPFGLNCAPLVFTKLMKPVVGVLRNKGLVSVIYLDDLLLIAKTKSKCQLNIAKTISLLESLGFIINLRKSCLIPSQTCKFLGFLYNSTNMTVSLPQNKKEKILELIKKFMSCSKCKIRDFAQFIGCLVSTCPAITYGWLYTKSFERQKFLALQSSRGDYNSKMYISPSLSQDFQWWSQHIGHAQNSLKPPTFEIEIFSDASLTGWGIYCKNETAHGLWNNREKEHHINYLELLAAFFGLKCFASHLSNCNILCRIDNTTALLYINRMGSIQFPKLNSLTRKIWQWCEKRKLFLFASYIKSKENIVADTESRKLHTETEWELNDFAFTTILEQYDRIPTVDLFASRNNTKCKKFVSWLRDPEAWAVDAFTLDWSKFYFYAFPPFSLILRALQKIISDKAEGILVVPNWTSQPWYPIFQSLLTEPPLIIKPNENLLLSFDRTPHPLWPNLFLAVGALSYKRSN